MKRLNLCLIFLIIVFNLCGCHNYYTEEFNIDTTNRDYVEPIEQPEQQTEIETDSEELPLTENEEQSNPSDDFVYADTPDTETGTVCDGGDETYIDPPIDWTLKFYNDRLFIYVSDLSYSNTDFSPADFPDIDIKSIEFDGYIYNSNYNCDRFIIRLNSQTNEELFEAIRKFLEYDMVETIYLLNYYYGRHIETGEIYLRDNSMTPIDSLESNFPDVDFSALYINNR